MRSLRLLIAIVTLTASVWAQNITGTIVIKKKLTKQSVTPSVSVYQRGPAVPLGKDAEEDPLAFERSRVVIYLEGPAPAQSNSGETSPANSSPPSMQQASMQQVSMQQIGRRFSPDLLVVPVGSTVSFPNMDPIFHNIFSLSKPRTFDLGSYNKGETRTVVFPRPGVVEVYCHLHPNMEATILVTPNRWYARSNGTGQYKIPDVPPGRYIVVAWHKSAGFLRKSVVVEAGHDSVVDFFVPVDKDPE
jgi:plastocyanin